MSTAAGNNAWSKSFVEESLCFLQWACGDCRCVKWQRCTLPASEQRGCGLRLKNHLYLCLKGLWLSAKMSTRYVLGFNKELLPGLVVWGCLFCRKVHLLVMKNSLCQVLLLKCLLLNHYYSLSLTVRESALLSVSSTLICLISGKTVNFICFFFSLHPCSSEEYECLLELRVLGTQEPRALPWEIQVCVVFCGLCVDAMPSSCRENLGPQKLYRLSLLVNLVYRWAQSCLVEAFLCHTHNWDMFNLLEILFHSWTFLRFLNTDWGFMGKIPLPQAVL